ncbi:FimV family protein [Chromobacterium sp.]|uniref:type IV pilus assembly protein FimV n=1 Tax=Chromobacterium sp. TaxID=306190 RepID=UPI0035ADB868
MADWLPQGMELIPGLALAMGLLTLLAALRWRSGRAGAGREDIADTREIELDGPTDAAGQPYQVDEVDLLTEVDIFIEFGYLGQAAQALRHYVDRLAPHSAKHLQRLTGLYLQTGALDDYGAMLERQHDLALIGREQLEQALEAGLRIERNHLALRVLAEQRLGWDPEAIRLRLGDDAPALEASAAPTAPAQAADVGDLEPCPLRPQTLLQGYAPLFPLNEAEKDAVAALLPAERQARVWLRWQEYTAAAAALEQALALRPDSLSHLLDLLHVHYRQRQLQRYVRVLWQFHLLLDGHGADLKEQLIHAGWLLGVHPALDLLALRPDRPELERIGRSLGLNIAAVGSAPQRLPLVTRHAATAELAATDPRAEADAYLSEGQVDMAIHILEQAVLAQPDDAANYPPLLQLYRRQDDPARFQWLLRQLRGHAPRLPLEVSAHLAGFDTEAGPSHRRMLAA